MGGSKITSRQTKKDAEKVYLRRAVRNSLQAQGFHVGDGINFRQRKDKRSIRKRHAHAVAKRISLAKRSLENSEEVLLDFIASGNEVEPTRISPKLHQVEAGTVESALFKYACLHWSIPISEGYGRRLRFLVFDDANGKLIGVIGLGDPVYSISARDRWVGWSPAAKAERLYHVMDAYVLGAVPPYSYLLGGKLIALVAACDEVRKAFRLRYESSVSLILGKQREPHLALLTTTSALGRSSVYNRVKFRGRTVFRRAGFTSGWGEFHFANGVYDRLADFAAKNCTPTAKQDKWGSGFRNRRELVRKALQSLDFSPDMLNHGIQREVFVIPLARNTRGYLRGRARAPHYYHLSFESAVRFWKHRWLHSRAQRDISYKFFDKLNWLLWSKPK
jgi:hypothetical protein